MKTPKNSTIAIITAIFLLLSGVGLSQTETVQNATFFGGGPGTINQLSQWKNDGTNITQNVASTTVKITGLESEDCIGTDADGVLQSGNCAGSSGTVTSVDMSVPTGLTISGNPITTSGTLALALDTGYVIPLTASTTDWQTAFGWGNHASAGYLTTVDISDNTNLTGDTEIVLTGDALSIASTIARDTELHSAVTLSGALDYITLVGQDIVRGAIDLAADITGTLPVGNGGTGITSLGTGVATWLGTPSSANLATAVTGETGSGALVFGTSPAFTTGLSTPAITTASGALTVTPAAGSNFNLALSTTGDFAVNTSQLYVDTSAGNVGIGTTTPGSLLHIESSAPVARIQANAAADAQLAFTRGSGGVNQTWAMGRDNTNGNFSIDYAASATGVLSATPLFNISTAGYVGIGTTTPGANLHVVNNTPGVAGWVLRAQTTGLSNESGFYQTSSNNMLVGVRDASGVVQGQISSSGSSYFNGGNVGIGDTSPASLLTVGNGDLFQVNSSGNVSTAGTLGVTGTSTLATTTITNLSIGSLSGFLKATAGAIATALIGVSDLATGTDGELITWDSSGNPATVAVGTSGQVLTSNGAGAAPTFQDAGGGGATKEFFVPVSYRFNNSVNQIPYDFDSSQFTTGEISDTGRVRFNTYMPNDFTSIVDIVVVMTPDATETIQWDTFVGFASAGQARDTHTASDLNRTLAVTANVVTEASIDQGDVATALNSLVAGDYLGVQFQGDTANLYIMGLRVKYE